MKRSGIKIINHVLENDLTYNGERVLSYKIDYPAFISPRYRESLKGINANYETKALEYQQYVVNVLYKIAIEQYEYDKQNNYPIRVFEVLVIYKVTYIATCIISLYFDQYEYTGGAHGNTVRYSQTWNLKANTLITLHELFHCGIEYKSYIFEHVIKEIKKDPSIYFEDYEKLVVQSFNDDSFYCTPNGIVIYYQQYDIAPYSSGIREFLIPYTKCVVNPIRLC